MKFALFISKEKNIPRSLMNRKCECTLFSNTCNTTSKLTFLPSIQRYFDKVTYYHKITGTKLYLYLQLDLCTYGWHHSRAMARRIYKRVYFNIFS